MAITLKRIDEHFKLEATNERGDIMHTNGSPGIGAEGTGFRPMETLLISLAGCSAIDIINVLNKSRQKIESFEMKISGTKREGIPSPYETIDVLFILQGKIKEDKMQKAIELTRTKYCSVYFSLHPDIEVSFRYEINN
jgi:putative redox protein